MRIYMIGQKGIPAASGGVERHVEELSTRLAARGHEVFVYCRSPYTSPSLKEYKGVHLIHLPCVHAKSFEAITHTFLATLHVLFQQADIIHYHAIGPSSLSFIPRLLKWRSRVVATFHCQDYFHEKWSLLARMYLRLGEWVTCHVPHRTIAVAKTLAAYARTMYGRSLVYIPNATSISEQKIPHAQFLRAWHLRKGSYIVWIGRLVPHKGVHELIVAYKKLSTKKKLVIVGTGSHTASYERMLRRSAQRNPSILLVGEQHGSALRALLWGAAVYAIPSASEELSISLLEAMAAGLPVVSSNIPENREALGDAAWFFNVHNINDLATKLHYAIRHPREGKALGERARARITKYYTWERIIPQIEDMYEELLQPVTLPLSVLKGTSRTWAAS